MVELEYNGNRYMVDGGQWYRRIEPTESLPTGYQFIERGKWQHGNFHNTIAGVAGMYRVPCADPRPDFKIGPEDELTQQPIIGEPCLPWILAKLSRQPEKAERTREILQRCMSELVRLDGE